MMRSIVCVLSLTLGTATPALAQLDTGSGLQASRAVNTPPAPKAKHPGKHKSKQGQGVALDPPKG